MKCCLLQLPRHCIYVVTLLLSNTYALCKCTQGISPFTSPHMMRMRKKSTLGLCLHHFRNPSTLQCQNILQDTAHPVQKLGNRETVHDKRNHQLKHSFVFIPVSRLRACTLTASLAGTLPSPKLRWAQLSQQKLGTHCRLKSPL